jgi:hypothetical protein
MTDANMKIWDQVDKTDPSTTKHVNARGGFTAIAAYSQIKRATEIFGPVGVGWGWDVSDPIFPPNDTVIVKVVLWHGSKDKTVTQYGQKKLASDEDAMKKATTDGITKCLSYLGFNADVFLGKFDDNKYVEERTAEELATSKAPEKKSADVSAVLNAITQTTTEPALTKIENSKRFAEVFEELTVGEQGAIKLAIIKKREEFNGETPFDEKEVAA